jgi:signal peptidase I
MVVVVYNYLKIYLKVKKLIVSSMFTRFKNQKVTVEGISMEPAFFNGQEIELKNIFFKFSPKRFNIVKFKYGKLTKLKRIIGLPLEIIEFNNNQVLINNIPLQDKFSVKNPIYAKQSFKIVKNEIFVLGDNRNYSNDSREFGTIKLNNVVSFLDF